MSSLHEFCIFAFHMELSAHKTETDQNYEDIVPIDKINHQITIVSFALVSTPILDAVPVLGSRYSYHLDGHHSRLLGN